MVPTMRLIRKVLHPETLARRRDHDASSARIKAGPIPLPTCLRRRCRVTRRRPHPVRHGRGCIRQRMLEPRAPQSTCGGRSSPSISWFRTDWQRGGALTGYATWSGDQGDGPKSGSWSRCPFPRANATGSRASRITLNGLPGKPPSRPTVFAHGDAHQRVRPRLGRHGTPATTARSAAAGGTDKSSIFWSTPPRRFSDAAE